MCIASVYRGSAVQQDMFKVTDVTRVSSIWMDLCFLCNAIAALNHIMIGMCKCKGRLQTHTKRTHALLFSVHPL